ncbi:MAG: N-acyl-D-amino-acid deacylase family protein, partial [Candidatus Binatia bacterium]
IRGRGLVAAPGFVDVHTHYDCQVSWDPALSPSSWHGVTTVVMGNCGFSIAPCHPEHRELLIEMLLYVEGMPTEALRSGIRWEWRTFPEYLGALERLRPAVNVAAFVGHSAVRFWVMREEATRRAATAAEVEAMRGVVREAMEAGAIGFSTSESPTHFFGDGTPVPSRVSPREELRALAGVLGELRRGIVEIAPLHTIGGSTDDRMEDQEFYAAIARATRRPVTWAPLHHSPFDPEGCLRLIEASAAAQRAGAPVYPQVGCKPLEVRIAFDAMGIAVANNPYWKPIFEKPKAERRELFGSRAFRDELREHSRPGGWVAMLAPSWEKILLRMSPAKDHAALADLTVAQIARRRGADEVDTLLDLALESDLRCQLGIPIMNDDEEYVGKLLRHPSAIVALSDAGAHVDSLADQGFTSTLLSRWVREKGTLTLEEAVRLVTSVPAGLYGLEGRGELAAGNPADVVVFDPDRVGSERVELVNDLPGGAARLLERPRGIEWVLVNGEVLVEEARPTEARSGKVLRSGRAT